MCAGGDGDASHFGFFVDAGRAAGVEAAGEVAEGDRRARRLYHFYYLDKKIGVSGAGSGRRGGEEQVGLYEYFHARPDEFSDSAEVGEQAVEGRSHGFGFVRFAFDYRYGFVGHDTHFSKRCW